MRTVILSMALGVGVLGLLATGQSRAVAAPPGDQPVLIQMTVPAGAEVWFDGARTTQRGTLRRFITPPLDPRHHYHYELRVHWMNGDHPVDETRRLAVHAGERVEINYVNPSTGQTVATSAAPTFRESRSAYIPPAAPTVSPFVSSYFESGGTPLGTAPPPRFYNENDYPPPGGPPGFFQNGVAAR